MKKCCFVIPYYGKLPGSFPVFLKSCEANPDFSWLLLTDDRTEYAYPPNFRVVYNTFADFCALADSAFGFPVRLENPYKLCDLKPAYGFLLESYLEGFSFWGHCDLDTVMGSLGTFLTDELLENYDKLFCLGHLTLYRNTPENNRVFMREIGGRALYREVFSTPDVCWFDEEYKDENNVNRIFLQAGKRVYQNDLSLNIDIGSRDFRRTVYCAESRSYAVEPSSPGLIYWHQGHLYRIIVRGGMLYREEFLYTHLQYRTLDYSPALLAADTFRIVPNRFVPASHLPKSPAEFYLIPKFSFSPRRILRAVRRRLHV